MQEEVMSVHFFHLWDTVKVIDQIGILSGPCMKCKACECTSITTSDLS